MSRRIEGSVLLIILIIFTIAMILVGGNQNKRQRIITVKVEGVSEEQMAETIGNITALIKGIQSLTVNPRTHLCTFRYQTSQVDLPTLREQLAHYGINITLINEPELLKSQPNNKELISIKFTPASRQAN